MGDFDRNKISSSIETPRAEVPKSPTIPHSQSAGSLARAAGIPEMKAFGKAGLVVAAFTALTAFGLHWYSEKLKTGAEQALKDEVKAHHLSDKAPTELVNMQPLAFKNPVSGVAGKLEIFGRNKESPACFDAAVSGGDAQGLFTISSVVAKGKDGKPAVFDKAYSTKICP